MCETLSNMVKQKLDQSTPQGSPSAVTDSDDRSSVASVSELSDITDDIRYLTCVVYSTLDHQQLIDATPLISNTETKILWVSAKRYQSATRTDGVIYRESTSHDAVELQDWDPSCIDNNGLWFSRHYISKLMKRSKAASEGSVKILLVQPKNDTKWSLPYRTLENDGTLEEMFVDCVHNHVPHIALQVHKVTTDTPKQFTDRGCLVEVNPCFYEWVGEIDKPTSIAEDQLSAASSSHSYASEETVPVSKSQVPLQSARVQAVQDDNALKLTKRPSSNTLTNASSTYGAQVVVYHPVKNYTNGDAPPSYLPVINDTQQTSSWIALSDILHDIRGNVESSFSMDFKTDCTDGSSLRSLLEQLHQRFTDREALILMTADTTGPQPRKWSIPQFLDLSQEGQQLQICEGLNKRLDLDIEADDIARQFAEHTDKMFKTTYSYKVPKSPYVATFTTSKTSYASRAIIYSYASRQTLCERGSVHIKWKDNEDSSTIDASRDSDWVRIGNLIEAIRSGKGVLEEPGKQPKLLPTVEDLPTMFAMKTLIELMAQWNSKLLATSQDLNQPSILMVARSDLECWTLPGGLSRSPPADSYVNSVAEKDAALDTLLEWVTLEADLDMTRAKWSHKDCQVRNPKEIGEQVDGLSGKVTCHYFMAEYQGAKLEDSKSSLQPSSEQPALSLPIHVSAPASTNQLSSVGIEEPFYNYIVGLVLADINHDDLPFASKGTRKHRAMYCSPTSGHEFCWVSVHELIRALSPIGNMEVRQTDGRHSKLPLIRQSTKEMDEAYYALRSLVRYHQAHEELHIDPVGGQSHLPQLLVLMKRMSGTATWSLLTDEFVSGRDVSRINTFVNMARFQLPLHIQHEHVNDVTSEELSNVRIDVLSYQLTEEDSAAWFKMYHNEVELPQMEPLGVTSVSSSDTVKSETSNHDSDNDAQLIAELKAKIETMEAEHHAKLSQLENALESRQQGQQRLQVELNGMQVRNQTLHSLIAELTSAIDSSSTPSALKSQDVPEASSSLSSYYEDDQLPHKWTNPILDMHEEQFIWQYVHAMIQREPQRYDLADHQLLVRRMTDICVQATHMYDTSRCSGDKPNPSKATLHGMKTMPRILTPEQAELSVCARCGRTSKVRLAYPSIVGTLTDLEDGYQELYNVPFCTKCTGTELLHQSDPGAKTASLCLGHQGYVRMHKGITSVDAMKPNPQYSSFENCPCPGRTMKFGVLKLTLEYPTKAEIKPDPFDTYSSLTPTSVIALPSRTMAKDSVSSPTLSTPIEAVEPVVGTSSPVVIQEENNEEKKPRVITDSIKISWKDGDTILKRVREHAQEFKRMPADKSSPDSVEDFAQCVHDVKTFLTKDTRMVQWLGTEAALKVQPLVDILVEIVKVVAGRAHKFTIADSNDLKQRLSATANPTDALTLETALQNFMNLFRLECLQMEQCKKYVKYTLYTPGYRTFKMTEEHFRRAVPLSEILHKQFGLCKPISTSEEDLRQLIFNALPESTQDGVMSKLRDRAKNGHEISLATMTLQYLKEVCHVLEDGRSRGHGSRSPSPYGRVNAMKAPPSSEGGEEEFCEQHEQEADSTANLQYSAYNRTQNTRVPPRSRSRSRGAGSNSAFRGRSTERPRRSLSPHPNKTGRLKVAATNGVLDAIIAFDPTKSNAANICANCGHEGHTARNCSEPYDADRVKRNIELYVKHKTRNVNAPKGHLQVMCTAMATQVYQDQCGSPPASSAGDTDADATDPEDNTSEDDEDEVEEKSSDSKRSPLK